MDVRLPEKKIFIIGAGSSISHSKGSFPSIDTFFQKAKETGLDKTEEFKRLAKYITENIGKNISISREKVNVEQIFTYLEIDYEKNSLPQISQLRNDFLYIIKSTLLELSQKLDNSISDYHHFVESLDTADTVITFNWDLLLDNALHREVILKERYQLSKSTDYPKKQYNNYIIELSALGELTWGKLTFSNPYRQYDSSKGYYLKAHGSIDWFYCDNQMCRAYGSVFPLLEPNKTYYCSECHEPLTMLIIPPILNKTYNQYPIIRKIWNLAVKEIKTATRLIIWGYSLPPTDFYVSWLLNQARQGNIQTLTIINPEVIDTKKKRIKTIFVRKFYNYFRDKVSKENIYLYETFSDYLNQDDLKKKYGVTLRHV